MAGQTENYHIYYPTDYNEIADVPENDKQQALSIEAALNGKQDTLESGTNIKTINNQSILGSGNITIQGGGGTSDYTDLINKPQINSVTLTGNKSLSDLGIQATIDSTHKLNSDLVDDTNQTNKFVTSTEKTTWNRKLDTSKVKNANSTTAGDVYDVRYINTMIGNIETLLAEV